MLRWPFLVWISFLLLLFLLFLRVRRIRSVRIHGWLLVFWLAADLGRHTLLDALLARLIGLLSRFFDNSIDVVERRYVNEFGLLNRLYPLDRFGWWLDRFGSRWW